MRTSSASLEDGVVVEPGTHAELIRRRGRYFATLSLQNLEKWMFAFWPRLSPSSFIYFLVLIKNKTLGPRRVYL